MTLDPSPGPLDASPDPSASAPGPERPDAPAEFAEAAPEAHVTDTVGGTPGGADVVLASVRPAGRISPTVGFVGGALLALVGIVTLVMSASGLVRSSAGTALTTPPSPSVPLVSPAVVTPPDLAHGRSIGPATAPVKVEIWEDFQCPICTRWNATVKQQLIDTYVRPGKVQVTFRDFIVIGRESIVAAVAARIADRDGLFWQFADRLFANQIGENAGSFAPARLVAIAGGLKMDWQRFETALLNETEDPATIQTLQANQQEGANLGITGTPSVTVNGTLLTQTDWPTVSAAIDKALAAK